MNSPEKFLAAASFAVAGASRDATKYGNIVFRALRAVGRQVYPINPNTATVEDCIAYDSIRSMPLVPEALSIVTAPSVTRTIVDEAIALGVEHIWMQPGAEDSVASQRARAAGLNVIDDGSCILVWLKRV